MEQSNGDNMVGGCVWSTGLTQEERDVVELLLEMRGVMLDMEADLRIPFQWGRKRKRSAIQVPVLPRFSSSTPPSLPQRPLNNGGANGGQGGCVVTAAVVKGEASSPATPLSLSLTESDEKPNNPLRTKASLKRKREYYLKIIEDLTKSQASLNQEIDNVKRYYGQLKAFNLKLKERRQELRNGPKSECKNPSLEIGYQTQILVHAPVNSSNSMAQNQHHNKHHQLQLQVQVPNTPHYIRLRLNNTSGQPQLCSSEGLEQFQHVSTQQKTLLPMPPSSSSPSGASLAMVNNSRSSNMGPKGVPDLNVSPEEFIQVDSYQPLDVNVTMVNKDLSRAMAALARQRRIQINKLKNPIGNSKPRFSSR